MAVLSMGPDQLIWSRDGTSPATGQGKAVSIPVRPDPDPRSEGYLVSDTYAATVWGVSDSGEVKPGCGANPWSAPEGSGAGRRGPVLVADPGASQIFRVTAPDRVERLLAEP